MHFLLDALFEALGAPLVSGPDAGAGGPCKVLVVAVGNPDRADDGVASQVAARLAGRLPDGASIALRGADIAGLIDAFAGLDALICVDAVAPIDAVGRIHRIDASVEDLPRWGALPSSHSCGLPETIALARALGALPKRVVVYGVEGACFDVGAPMTPEVAAAVAATADQVVQELAAMSRGG